MTSIKTLAAIGVLISSIVLAENAAGQAAGSSSLYSGFVLTAGGTQADVSETLYIGPGTYEIGGIWEIYAKYVYVSPGAEINGAGTIRFYNPSDAAGAASPTYIDGNDAPFRVNIELHNAANMVLADIADPGFGDSPSVENNASLRLHKNFHFAVDNGDVILGMLFSDGAAGNIAATVTDFIFAADDATITNFGASRMVVTSNSIQGHMVKVMNEGPSSDFTFPVGIAEGDYTPATLSYSGIVSYHVSVTDYAATTSQISMPQEGMDRAWHIYGGFAQQMILQHNPSTNGTGYTDDQAFITQYQGGGVWTSSAATDYISSGLHAHAISGPSDIIGTGIPLMASDYAWYTKSSDSTTPLPVRLISFDARKDGRTVKLIWVTANEIDNKGFEVESSPDGRNWVSIGWIRSKAENGSGSQKLEYTFSDDSPLSGLRYYRLRQSDLDGTVQYSRIRIVRSDAQHDVYPNPASESIHIAGLSATESIRVYDQMGKLVQQVSGGSTTGHILIGDLNNGVYLIRIIADNGTVSCYKVVKSN